MADFVFYGVLLFYAFTFYRLDWVYRARNKLRQSMTDDQFITEYGDYWGLSKMYYHFWIWDIEKMKTRGRKP